MGFDWCGTSTVEGGGKGVGADAKMLFNFQLKKMNLYQCEVKKKEH